MRMILTKGTRMQSRERGAALSQGPYGSGRSTRQRRIVAAAAEALPGAFTAEDLVARVRRDAPGVSTATVYRSITAMSASGFLAPVGQRDGAALYVRCAEKSHHHHVVCTSCGATAHAPCPLDTAGGAPATPDGFVVTGHEVRLYGLCGACAARTAAADDCSCDGPAPSDAGRA